MTIVSLILPTFALATALVLLLVRCRAVRGTTLTTATGLLAATAGLWCIAWGVTAVRPIVTDGRADLLWYAVAVFGLCPPIAVLGARNPGARAWPWFVLLPLLLVLGLPAAAQWPSAASSSRFQLDLPPLLGYALVAVMGLGNYVGTRHALPALFYAAALALLVGPLVSELAGIFPATEAARGWATLGLSAAMFAAVWPKGGPPPPTNYDRVWLDFRDSFGMVWARRVADRINETGRAQQWPLRLELHGLVWTAPAVADDERRRALAGLDQTLRWLLKRFVSDEWIARRLVEGRELRK